MGVTFSEILIYSFIDQPLGVSTPENEKKPFVCEGEYTKYGSEFRVVSLWAVEDNTDMRNIPELNEPLRMPNGDDNMAEVLRNEEKVKHRRRKKKETGEMRQQTLEETGGVAVNVDMDEEDLLKGVAPTNTLYDEYMALLNEVKQGTKGGRYSYSLEQERERRGAHYVSWQRHSSRTSGTR